MRFIIADVATLNSLGIEIIPTMRQSIDKTKVVLHEEYVSGVDEFSTLPRYEFDDTEFRSILESEDWIHGEDYVQPSMDYSRLKVIQLLTSDAKTNVQTYKMSNKEALDIKEFYPTWKSGINVKVGERYNYNSLLWECIQDHKTQTTWKPSIETSSLWKVVEVEHEGTQEDPIPFTPPMELFAEKYYTQNEVLYKCTRDSGIPLAYNLSELVGHYVEPIN